MHTPEVTPLDSLRYIVDLLVLDINRYHCPPEIEIPTIDNNPLHTQLAQEILARLLYIWKTKQNYGPIAYNQLFDQIKKDVRFYLACRDKTQPNSLFCSKDATVRLVMHVPETLEYLSKLGLITLHRNADEPTWLDIHPTQTLFLCVKRATDK